MIPRVLPIQKGVAMFEGSMSEGSRCYLYRLESVPEESLIEVKGVLAESSLTVVSESHEPGVQANAEWALPALVSLLVAAKPFLDGFFKELGTGAAKALKDSLRRLYKELRGKELKFSNSEQIRVALDTHPGDDSPLEVEGIACPVIRLELRIEGNGGVARNLCLILPSGLTEEALHCALDLLFDSLSLQLRALMESDIENLDPLRLLYQFDPESRRWHGAPDFVDGEAGVVKLPGDETFVGTGGCRGFRQPGVELEHFTNVVQG